MAYPGYAATTNPLYGPVDNSGWWGNSLPNTSAAPIATADMVTQADPSMWTSFSNWLNDSGILGKRLADGTQVQGWGAPALGLASGLANSYFGMKQLNLARDTLNANKEQFRLNFDASKNTTNAQLQDRQRARVASNPGAYQSVGDYMNQYGIKG